MTKLIRIFFLVKDEWSTHQKLAMKEFKQGLSSYCDIGLYHLKIQMTILEKLQVFFRKINSILNKKKTIFCKLEFR